VFVIEVEKRGAKGWAREGPHGFTFVAQLRLATVFETELEASVAACYIPAGSFPTVVKLMEPSKN
jgi:hypothetical protein